MSSIWDISISEPISPQSPSDNFENSLRSPIYGLMDNSSNDIDFDNNSDSNLAADNLPSASSSSSGELLSTPTLDLTRESGWNRTLQESLDNAELEDEIASINRFCDNIEHNLAEIGLGPVAAISTPLIANSRRSLPENTTSRPIDLIDLSVFDDSPLPRSARSIAPEAIIDLCTPEPPRRPAAYINLEDSSDSPRRRQHFNRLFGNPSNQNAQPAEQDSSPPKRKCATDKDANSDSNDNSYKCPICLDSVRMREPSSTRCGHIFCKSCIEAAVQATHKCPLCNKKITMRSIFRIYL